MKNLNKLIVLLVSVFLLSSCGSLSISQKRYSRGLNIDWFSKKEENKEIPQTKANKKKQAEIEALANKTNEEVELSSEDISKTEAVESTEVVEQVNVEPAIEEPVKTTQFSKSTKPSKQAVRQVRKQAIQTLKKDIQAKNSTLSPSNSNKTNELDVLLLVIIAIFIPPLAVYLYYGSPETHFWINLILFLVFGGLAFSGGFYGWAGIAFIHALLVIFGVIG
jgi:uncharacterized membrane protein YqaE (UPF0057 family)